MPGPPTTARSTERTRRPWRWVLVPLLAPFAFFVDALAGRRLLAVGDGWTYYLPLHVITGRMWADGHLPAWLPTQFSGAPLLAVGQASVFYPFTWLFAVLPATLANNLFVISCFAIAGAGAWALSRHLTGDPVAAVVSGLAFGASGFLWGHLVHQAIIATVAWLPWLVLGVELCRQRLTPGRVTLAAGSLAAMAFAGHFQMLAIALFAVGLYALVLAVWPDDRPRTAAVGALAATVVVGVALGAVQLLPTASVLDATAREELSFAAATEFDLPPSHLALLTFPLLFGNLGDGGVAPFEASYAGAWNLSEMAGYVGTGALVLAVVGLVAARRDRRAVALAVAAGGALVVAVADATPVGQLVHELPVYGQFRAWARYVVVVDLVIAVLAGYGVASLRARARAGAVEGRTTSEQRDRAPLWTCADRFAPSAAVTPLSAPGGFAAGPLGPRPRPSARPLGPLVIAAGVAIAVLVVAGLVAPALLDEYLPDGGAPGWAVGLPLAAAVAVFGGVVLFRRAPRAAGAVCAVVVAADLVGGYAWFADRGGALPPEVAADAVDEDEPLAWGGVDDAGGGIDRYLLGSFTPSLGGYVPASGMKGARSATGFDPLAPAAYTEAVAGMEYFGGVTRPEDLWRPGSDLLDLLRVTTLLVSTVPGEVRPGPDAELPEPERAGPELLRYEHEPALPDAWLVASTRRAGRAEVLAAIAGQAPFDPAAEALVEEPCRACPEGSPGTGAGEAVRRVSDDPNHIRVEVDPTADALLLVSEAWFPGWSATVDGEPAQVVRADGVVLGVPVDAGATEVTLTYHPPGLRAGAAVTALAALGLAAWALVDRRRRRPSA